MASGLIRAGVVAASMAAAMATEGVPSCAKTGMGLNDPHRNHTHDAVLPTAEACQQLCSTTTYCEHFTFYTNANACWLQGNNVTEFESANALSGPVKCEEVVTDAKEVVVGGEAGKTLVGAEGKSDNGMLYILAGGLGAALVAAGAMAAMAPSGDRKKNSKRGVQMASDGPKTAAELYAQMAGVELGAAPAAPGSAVQFSQMAPMPQMTPYMYAPQMTYAQVPTEPVQYYYVDAQQQVPAEPAQYYIVEGQQ